ncbi:hypothetical protein OROGR_017168 [Orobanche gracilis]
MLKGLLALHHLGLPPAVRGGVRCLCSSSKVASHNSNSKPNGEVHVHSESEARDMFESWCKKYGRTYTSEEEKLYRFGVFTETLACGCVTRLNEGFDEPIFKCFGTNCFDDWTRKEVKDRPYGGRDC